MKGIRTIYLVLIILFSTILIVSNVFFQRIRGITYQKRNVLLNRIASDFQEAYAPGMEADDVICKVYSDHRDGFQMLYGERNLADLLQRPNGGISFMHL